MADISSGVDVGDVSTIDTDDPVIRFFQSEFKKQLQKEIQRAQAASKQRWSTPAASKSDELLAERVGIIFKAAFGVSTGIDVDRPGARFDRKALADSTAKASDLAQKRALLIEHERQEHLQVLVGQQVTAKIREQLDADEKARQDRERRLPSWKRGRDEEGEHGAPRPSGR